MLTVGLINAAASLVFVLGLPETVPTHFDAKWICNDTGSRWLGMGISAILLVLVPVFLLVEHSGKNADKNGRAMSVTMLAVEVLLVAVNWTMLFIMDSGAKLGDKISISYGWLFSVGFGALFTVIGNYLPTVRQNRTLGLKAPWTLSNENCWNLSHRFAGRLMVVSGLLLIAAGIVMNIAGAGMWLHYVVGMTVIFAVMAVSLGYSYAKRNA